MFAPREELFEPSRLELTEAYGPVDHVSSVRPFGLTICCAQESSERLLRQFLSSTELIDPVKLAEIKLCTNALEQQHASAGERQANLGPGYIDLSKLVLATTENHQHRICLGQGIYAEVTLRYTHKTFRPRAWTCHGYRTDH